MADIVARLSSPIFLNLTEYQVSISTERSVQATPDSVVSLATSLPQALVHSQQFVTINTLSTVVLDLLLNTPNIDIFKKKILPIDRRSHRVSFQARLGSRLDVIKRKVLDNQLLLSSHPTNMLRISTTRDSKTHDVKMRTVTSEEVLPILLPVMKDVPMRRLDIDEEGHQVLTLSMTDKEDFKPFEIYCPVNVKLSRDDLLFRIITDPHSDRPYVMVLQIKDELMTLGYNSLLYVKYQASFFDERLPSVIVEKVYQETIRREDLQW